MPNNYFRFKQFTVEQERSAMKVCTDACLFGAWVASLLDKSDSLILDIGTGTGLLSLMLAQKTNGQIDAVEIDGQAFAEAQDNFNSSPWSERLKAIHVPVQEYFPDHRYDFIISNPPFYDKDLKSDDEKRNLALHSSGLDLPELLKSVKRLLKDDGRFAILLPFKRSREFEQMVEFSIIQKIVVKPNKDHNAFRCIYLLGKSENEGLVDELIIKNIDNEYTEQFYELLKDYYLFENKV
jgi:tRNA1Val (adenine37-N6)-methyltransferase